VQTQKLVTRLFFVGHSNSLILMGGFATNSNVNKYKLKVIVYVNKSREFTNSFLRKPRNVVVLINDFKV